MSARRFSRVRSMSGVILLATIRAASPSMEARMTTSCSTFGIEKSLT